jgi:hypothetical protein
LIGTLGRLGRTGWYSGDEVGPSGGCKATSGPTREARREL